MTLVLNVKDSSGDAHIVESGSPSFDDAKNAVMLAGVEEGNKWVNPAHIVSVTLVST